MTTLVIGGAGYIGAHVARLHAERGDTAVVVDDLSTGLGKRGEGLPLERLDVSADGASERLAEVAGRHGADSMIHFAAHKQVGESVEKPMMYYHDNIAQLANTITACELAGVEKLVFSSSAAVYGVPDVDVVTEELECRPINPYGATKLIGEWMLRDAARATGLRTVALRYFNVAGAGWPDLGDSVIMNLVPIVLDRLDRGLAPIVFGDDYDTPDGTCIRDYVHVLDLADAHIAALDYLERDQRAESVFNVGTGTGSSVLEVIDAIARARGTDITPEIGPRRPGDPARLVCSPERIERELGWSATKNLDDIVRSAIDAWTA